MSELQLDHVALAVPDLDRAATLYARLLGTPAGARERVGSQGVDVCFLSAGAATLELLEPHGPDTPVGRFLARRGPGMHHLAFRVVDLAETLQELEAQGYELVDREPRPGAHGRRVAFLHPRSTQGVLIELVEVP
jgi:methylmalonyl-CoA/ethylmalonyl-CoA epimerase